MLDEFRRNFSNTFHRIFSGKPIKTESDLAKVAEHTEIPLEKLKILTCLDGKDSADVVIVAIKSDLESKSSVLELMKSYISELEGKLDNKAAPFNKLAKLFECGKTPDRVEGHHYGITVGLKMGDLSGIQAEYGNWFNFLWGTSLGRVPPWVGKTFNPINRDKLMKYTEGSEQGDLPTYLGINHFNEIKHSATNYISIALLSFWMHLKNAPKEEQDRYGYEKIGGNFIARRTRSVYHDTPRDVFQLNYRWSKLGNPPPLNYLIDEIVEISDGLYLGQLIFATKSLFSHYDPKVPHKEYDYEHFGYFLLMDERWKVEAQKQFPYIGVPATEKVKPTIVDKKFINFTFADPPDGNCNDKILAQIQEDLKSKETILDLLKFYSDELQAHWDKNNSPYFARLQELFNRGIAPEAIKGSYHGAVVSFRGHSFLDLFNINVLNIIWGLIKFLSPWSGKSFQEMDKKLLIEITNGKESGEQPTFWGANTYSQRTTRKRIAGQVLRLIRVRIEEATPEEKKTQGYDFKSFFFIGKRGTSVNDDNRGKKVFQINYRWPKLKTFPPDNFCIDESVQIAEGLYIGQLTYATDLFKKYDPDQNPSVYKYKVFGYFLLLDNEWQNRRLKIGFDPYNV